METYMTEETHLGIVWGSSASSTPNVVKQMQMAGFEVCEQIKVVWTKENFAKNLTRFYGVNLPPGSQKERYTGILPFDVIIFVDKSPKHAARQTTSGTRVVNTNVFDFKQRIRTSIKYHGTDTIDEFARDFFLLFGQDYTRIPSSEGPDGNKFTHERDLVGTNGWDSMEQVLNCLNSCIRYVVLRNFEMLPSQFILQEHGDVDLLVENYKQVCHLLDAHICFPQEYRVHTKVQIGTEKVPFDFRYVGDNYYCKKWEEEILSTRELRNGFYAPRLDHYYYSLIYHAYAHKGRVAPDYVDKLVAMSKELGNPITVDDLGKRTAPVSQLKAFMKAHGYDFIKPTDLSVPCNLRW